jgi:hypothetical protein
MTREEEIYEAMKESVTETINVSGYNFTNRATDLLECAFTKGAEWADKTMIEKICIWLDNVDFDMEYWNIVDGFCKEKFINDLKKAMN